jgi:hypothetical protein
VQTSPALCSDWMAPPGVISSDVECSAEVFERNEKETSGPIEMSRRTVHCRLQQNNK